MHILDFGLKITFQSSARIEGTTGKGNTLNRDIMFLVLLCLQGLK